MRRITTMLALAVLFVFAAHAARAEVEPGNLQCEYSRTPLGIETRRPRLSWALEAEERAQKQSAYRVIVASSKEKLRKNEGDLWDTGKVKSDRCVNIPYGGKALTSGMRCWWKVRAWDKDGEPGPWSEPSWWEMGLIGEDPWKATWICPPKSQDPDPEPDPAPLFRREFEAEKKIESARVYISGMGYYELYLNGDKVGNHVLDPAFTRYDERVLYETYDVTDQIKQGKNAAGVVVGNGWYNMHTRAVWNFDKAPWRDRPTMICQLQLTFADGSTRTIVSDGNWKVSTGPIRFDSIRNGETYDARREKPGWATPSYDASGWNDAASVDGPKGTLVSQTMPPVRVTDTLEPEKITEPEPGHYVFDFGQNMAGWARLHVSGSRGDKVKMRYGERLNDDGTLDQEAIAKFVKEGEFQTDTYILDGEGRETWEASFTYHGFRYVEVTGFPGEPTKDSLEARAINTDARRAGTFRCSNEMFNRVQHQALWAYRSNYVGYPTDCPQREKNGWTGDAQLAVEQAMYNWDNTAAYEKWTRDFRDVQRKNGHLPTIVPTGGWGYEFLGSKVHPAWDGALVLVPWHLFQYRGDSRVLAENYDVMESYLGFMGDRANEHIIKGGIGDWSPADTETPRPYTSTAYYYETANLMSEIAEVLDRQSDAERYASLAEDIKAAFNERFYKGDGTYANGSQTAQSCALYFGLCPDGERQKVLEGLVEAVEEKDRHIDTGILGAKFLFYVLTRNGHADLAYTVANQKTHPGYGHWVEEGATTMWEGWSGGGSRNHIMFGDIVAWFYRTLAGIRIDPDEPNFKHIVIKPHLLGDLEWVSADHETMYGTVRSDWERGDGELTLTVEVPVNTTATVHIPAADGASVMIDGRKAAKATGVSFVRREDGRSVYRLGSGTYSFTSTLPEE